MAHLNTDQAALSGAIEDTFDVRNFIINFSHEIYIPFHVRVMGLTGMGVVSTHIEEQVNVPTTACPLSEESYRQLTELVDTLAPCDDHGLMLYYKRIHS